MKFQGTGRSAAWRRAGAACVLGLGLFAAPSVSNAQDAPDGVASEEQEPVDAATKQLLAAHGLFQRGLFKLAAPEYENFLKDGADHPDANTARYALAVCRYRLNEFEPAIELLNEVARDAKFRQRDEALAVLGHSHLARREYDAALAAFERLLKDHAQSKHAETASLNRAQVLYLSGKKPQAAEAAKRFLDDYPNSAERPTGLYFLALSQYGQNQHADAGKSLSELLRAHADSRHALDARLLLGQCYEAAGELDEAAARYRDFVDAAPAARKADGQYSLGVVLFKARKHDDAIRELSGLTSDAQRDNPYAAPARLQLGLVQLAAGKVGDARRTLQQVASRDAARRDDARYALAQCDIADKRFDAARETLDELSRALPPRANLPQILLDRAVCAAEAGKHEEAAAELESFLAKFAETTQAPEATYRRAYSLHRLGNYDESRALSRRVAAMKDNPFAAPAAELDAENLFLAEKYADAAAGFEALAKAANEDERRMRFVLRRAQCAYFSGDYPGATKLLEPLAASDVLGRVDELQPVLFFLGDALLQQGKHAEAAEALGQFVRSAKGDKREARFKLGLAQLRAGEEEAAERSFTQVVSGGGDSPWARRAQFERGQLLYKQKKPQPAAEALRRVATADAPEELAAPSRYLLGWIDFDAKRYEQAAEAWREMVAAHGTHALAADATFQRGVALKEAGKHEDALEALNGYLSRHKDGPHAAKARQLAAASLTALGKHDEAEGMLATLAADTRSATDAVLYDLAWTQRSKKDPKAAAETYRRLIRQFKESKLAPAARAELAELLYAEENYSEAAQLLEPVVADENVEATTLLAARYRLGWCYEKLGQKDKAAATLAAFAEKHGDSELAASALLQAGLSFAADGRMDRAEQALKTMLDKFPDHKQASVALLKLGEVQAEGKEFAASRQSFQRFLDRHGDDPLACRAQFGIGWAHENEKRFDDARAAYRKTIASTDTETAARAQFQIGETLLAEEKFEEAAAALLAVEDVYAYPQWSARALLEAGRAFEQLKQPDVARRQYKAVTEKYKDLPEAGLAAERLRELPE